MAGSDVTIDGCKKGHGIIDRCRRFTNPIESLVGFFTPPFVSSSRPLIAPSTRNRTFRWACSGCNLHYSSMQQILGSGYLNSG
ncbi:hypothetical protein IID10_04850 [candidate division KSB1 bacterium]|nr:hypothetical protein [candidate division KSB1 bacterium]